MCSGPPLRVRSVGAAQAGPDVVLASPGWLAALSQPQPGRPAPPSAMPAQTGRPTLVKPQTGVRRVHGRRRPLKVASREGGRGLTRRWPSRLHSPGTECQCPASGRSEPKTDGVRTNGRASGERRAGSQNRAGSGRGKLTRGLIGRIAPRSPPVEAPSTGRSLKPKGKASRRWPTPALDGVCAAASELDDGSRRSLAAAGVWSKNSRPFRDWRTSPPPQSPAKLSG